MLKRVAHLRSLGRVSQARHDPRGRLGVVRRRRGRAVAHTRRFGFRGRDQYRRELEQARANQPSIVRGADREHAHASAFVSDASASVRLAYVPLSRPLILASACPRSIAIVANVVSRPSPRCATRTGGASSRSRGALGEATGRVDNRVGAKEEQPDENPDRGVVHAPRVGVQEGLREPEGVGVGARNRRRGFEPSLRGGRVAVGVRARRLSPRLTRETRGSGAAIRPHPASAASSSPAASRRTRRARFRRRRRSRRLARRRIERAFGGPSRRGARRRRRTRLRVRGTGRGARAPAGTARTPRGGPARARASRGRARRL